MKPHAVSTRFNYGTAGRLGVILPSGNTAVEPQFETLRPWGMSCHYARLALTGSSDQQLMAMAEHVEEAALLLKDAGVGLIAFHCTAVSTWNSALEDSILKRIQAATQLPAIATSQALAAALSAVGGKRLALLSPYNQAIAQREQAFLEEHGFTIVENRFLGLDTPDEMIAVPPQQWFDMLMTSDCQDADAMLVSCTAIRAVEVVDAAEQALGKPVITSNSAMLWYSARRLGIAVELDEIGRLGALRLPRS